MFHKSIHESEMMMIFLGCLSILLLGGSIIWPGQRTYPDILTKIRSLLEKKSERGFFQKSEILSLSFSINICILLIFSSYSLVFVVEDDTDISTLNWPPLFCFDLAKLASSSCSQSSDFSYRRFSCFLLFLELFFHQ